MHTNSPSLHRSLSHEWLISCSPTKPRLSPMCMKPPTRIWNLLQSTLLANVWFIHLGKELKIACIYINQNSTPSPHNPTLPIPYPRAMPNMFLCISTQMLHRRERLRGTFFSMMLDMGCVSGREHLMVVSGEHGLILYIHVCYWASGLGGRCLHCLLWRSELAIMFFTKDFFLPDVRFSFSAYLHCSGYAMQTRRNTIPLKGFTSSSVPCTALW